MKLRRSTQVRPGRARAFTLVEVILAISIAIGLLVVALCFQGQAANLRAQLLDESDRIATMRLVMDRLAADLRTAFAQPQYGFTGDATSLRFVTVEGPSRTARTTGSSIRADLRLVTYGLGKTIEGTNEIVSGLTRTEQPLLEKPSPRTAFAAPVAPEATNAPARGPEPMTDAIRFLRIWYWDGYGWSATWDSSQLPRGVEITLGTEPLPEDASLVDYPGDLFRRVIHLPASREVDDFFDFLDAPETSAAVTTPPP